MCLAVAPNQNSRNGFISQIWRRIAATPIRLLTLCALFHIAVFGGLLMHDIAAATTINTHAYMFVLAYGIFALLAFGYLLTWLPRRFSLSPVHYARYNGIYLFTMAALVTIEISLYSASDWIFAGMLLLVPAWLIALQSLWHLHSWLNANVQAFSRVLMLLLALNFICLALSITGQLVSADMLTIFAISSSNLLVWPLLLLTSLVLFLIAPAKGRIISL